MQEKHLPAQINRNELLSPEQLNTVERNAGVFVKAGMFKPTQKEREAGIDEATKEAQATVLVMAGQEYGMGAFQAIKSLHLIGNEVCPGYQAIGAMINKYPGYRYEVIERTNEAAEIEIFKHGKSAGKSRFTVEDMQKAGYGGPNYQKRMRVMLFARAMSEGANAICPEVFGGAVHTPADFGYEELGNGELLDVKELQARLDNPQPFISEKKVEKREARKVTQEPVQEAQDTEIVEESQNEKQLEASMSVVDHHEAALEVAIEGGAPPETIEKLQQTLDEQNKPKPADFLKLQAAGKKQGWEPPQIAQFIKIKYPDLGDSWQKTMNVATYNEIFRFISNNTFGSETVTALGVK